MIRRLWYAWARRFDLITLWPAFKREARDLGHAREGFIIHMALDHTWRNHCKEWDEEQFAAFVREHLT